MDNASQNNDDVQITYGSIRQLTTEECDQPMCFENGYCYVVIDPYVYKSGNRTITVPVGFLTDGASGPGPDIGNSWLFHDWLYSKHCFDDGTACTRNDADSIMSQLLQKENLYRYKWVFDRISHYNFFYSFSSAWNTSGTRGPQMLNIAKSAAIIFGENDV